MEEMWSVSGRKEVQPTDVSIPICAVCKLDGKVIRAVGMCETCPDDLCEECSTIHCKPKPMRGHVLRRSVFVGEKTGTFKTQDDISKCKAHENKMIEYYCEDHDELGCSQCFVTKHRPCKNVIVVADVAATTQNSGEFQHLENDLKYIETTVESNAQVIVDLRDTADKTRKVTTKIVEECGIQMKSCIDKFVARQMEQIKVLANEDLKKLGELGETVRRLKTAPGPIKEFIESNKKGKKPELLYIAMRHFQKEITTMKAEVDRNCQASVLSKYQFGQNMSLLETLQGEQQRVRVTRIDSLPALYQDCQKSIEKLEPVWSLNEYPFVSILESVPTQPYEATPFLFKQPQDKQQHVRESSGGFFSKMHMPSVVSVSASTDFPSEPRKAPYVQPKTFLANPRGPREYLRETMQDRQQRVPFQSSSGMFGFPTPPAFPFPGHQASDFQEYQSLNKKNGEKKNKR